MLFQNEIFMFEDRRLRFLDVSDNNTQSWVIDVDAKFAWPQKLPYQEILNLSAIQVEDVGTMTPSNAMKNKRDLAMSRIAPLIEKKPKIFSPQGRAELIESRALELGCSQRTLHKDLRRYWQGGQTPEALLANYNRSGRSGADVTAGRGRSPKGEHSTYQLIPVDIAFFKAAIDTVYMRDKRRNAADAYQRLLESQYTYLDGNGKPFIKPIGQHPTIRQFRHFLHSNYSIESRIRARDGDKDFERDHRAKVDTIMSDCLGVGHYYEIDATICDVYIVSSEDVNKLVGKPTYYLIVDRKSRLIVGFYIGLENASWICAMEAILSISMDKSELCARYGVEYNPEDWPAHCVMPKEFLADRGEMISNASSQIAGNLGLTVTNVPGKRPDWKPLVECGFKLTHDAIHDVAPAYDPPSNATKRRGIHYEKDACLTLKGFGNIILNAIISHNRRAIRDYPFDLKELTAGIESDPISLWNHGIISRSGLLTKYSESKLRNALLPRETAAVTAEGIVFNNCHYTCAEAIAGGWFVKARKKTYRVDISFDTRVADCIYIHVPGSKGQPIRAELSPRSKKYLGLSVAEVKFYESLRAAVRPEIEQSRMQSALEFHTATNKIVADSKKRLRAEGTGKSRTSRRADIKEDRQIELSKERNERAGATANADHPSSTKSADVVSISSKRGAASGTAEASLQIVAPGHGLTATPDIEVGTPKSKEKTLEEIAQEARKMMLHG